LTKHRCLDKREKKGITARYLRGAGKGVHRTRSKMGRESEDGKITGDCCWTPKTTVAKGSQQHRVLELCRFIERQKANRRFFRTPLWKDLKKEKGGTVNPLDVVSEGLGQRGSKHKTEQRKKGQIQKLNPGYILESTGHPQTNLSKWQPDHWASPHPSS